MNDDQDPTWAPLDPSRDPERWEAMVRGIVDRAAPILAGYAARGPAELLAAWLRPTLAAAAIVSALALGALVSGSPEPETGAKASAIPSRVQSIDHVPSPVVPDVRMDMVRFERHGRRPPSSIVGQYFCNRQ